MKLVLLILIIAPLALNKLYQVVSLTRHGARFHVNDFGDGNDTKQFWGELTSVGMRQHQNLGKDFRKQYIQQLGFLSSDYKYGEIEVYSTPYNRTMLSIQSQLYGLYPLGTGYRLPQVKKQLIFPPYSNNTDADQTKYAIPKGFQPLKVQQSSKVMITDCPKYDQYSNQNFGAYSDVLAQMNITYYPFFKKLAPIFNFSAQTANFYTMLRVLDVINVDNYLGKAIPGNLSIDDQNNAYHLGNWYYFIAELNKVSLFINSGKFKKILTTFESRISNLLSYPLKWSFLSGHDTDIIAMQIALNLSSYQCLEQLYRKGSTKAINCEVGASYFASNIIFELHSDDQKSFYVKIRSNGKYVRICKKGQYQCQFGQFRQIVKKNISLDINDLCGRKIE